MEASEKEDANGREVGVGSWTNGTGRGLARVDELYGAASGAQAVRAMAWCG